MTQHPAKHFPTRRRIEGQIIRRVIADALKDRTIELSVDDEPPSRSRRGLCDEILAVDEARLYFHRKGDPRAYATVFFVLGNSGYDVICDYSTSLDPILAGANALAEELEARYDR